MVGSMVRLLVRGGEATFQRSSFTDGTWCRSAPRLQLSLTVDERPAAILSERAKCSARLCGGLQPTRPTTEEALRGSAHHATSWPGCNVSLSFVRLSNNELQLLPRAINMLFFGPKGFSITNERGPGGNLERSCSEVTFLLPK